MTQVEQIMLDFPINTPVKDSLFCVYGNVIGYATHKVSGEEETILVVRWHYSIDGLALKENISSINAANVKKFY